MGFLSTGLDHSSGRVICSGCEYVGKLHLSLVFRNAFSLFERKKFYGFRAKYVASYCSNVNAGSCRGNTCASHAVVVVWYLGSDCGNLLLCFLDGICDMSCFVAEGDF